MAQEFNIPGLKEAIEDVNKLNKAVNETAKNLLNVAISGEKSMNAFKDGSGIKNATEAKRQYTKTTADTSQATALLEAAEKKLAFAQSDLGKKISEVNLQIQRQNAENKANADVVNLANEALKREVNTIAEARAQNALLTQARNGVNVSTAEGKSQLTIFNDALDKNNKFIKDNADAALKQKMGIGDYAGGVKTAMEQTGLFSGKIGQLSNTAIGFVQTGAQAVTKIKDINDSVVKGAKDVGAYVTSKLSLISVQKTETAAIELGTLATEENAVATTTARAVVSGFTQAEKASTVATEVNTIATEANAIATAEMAGASAGLAVVTEATTATEVAATGVTWGLNTALAVLLAPVTLVIAAIALLVFIFKDFAPVINPIKDAFAAVKAVIGVLVSDVFALVTGTKSLTEVFSSLGSETSKAAAEAYKLAAAQREVIKAERELELSSAKAQAEITKLLVQSKNRTLPEEERIAMLDKAIKKEKENVSNQLELNNKKIANARLVLTEGKVISDEDMILLAKGNANYAQSIKKKYNLDQDYIDNLRKLQVDRYKIIEDSSRVEEKANNFRDKYEDAAESKRQKAQEKAEKDAETAQKKKEDADKKALDNEKKSMEFLISTKKLVLDNEIASYKQEENLIDNNISHIRVVSLEKQAISDLEMQKNKIGIKDKKDLMLIEQKGSEEIVKIKREESEALSKILTDNSKFELELYDLNNKTLIEEGKTLTDLLVNEEKKRIEKSLEIHKSGLREELGIDKNLSDQKLKEMSKTNGLLTALQLKYLQGLEKLDDSAKKEIKKNNTDLLATKEKEINEEVKLEQTKFKLINKNVLDQNKNEFKLEQARIKKLRDLYKDDAKKTKEIDAEVAKNKVDLENAILRMKEDNLNRSLNLIIDFAGKESEVGKAAAIAQVFMETYKGASAAFILSGTEAAKAAASAAAYDFAGASLHTTASVMAGVQGGLIIANGAVQAAKISGIGAFEIGTLFAPYSGKAIVDEAGAEIHTDIHGNIKSMGESSGARLTDIVKGDKIIPADLSAIIKSTMFSGALFQYEGKKDVIDYAEMGKYFDKSASKIVNAVNKNGKNQLSVHVSPNISDRVRFKGKKV
jgi:hypothetical protein